MHEVFGNTTKRIMCWSHKYRAYKDNASMRKLSRLNKNIANELDEDLKQIQWMISNDDEFVHVYNLLEKSILRESTLMRKKILLLHFGIATGISEVLPLVLGTGMRLQIPFISVITKG